MRRKADRALTDSEVEAIARFLDRGCPTPGVSLSPWGAELLANAYRLLKEVKRAREVGKFGQVA